MEDKYVLVIGGANVDIIGKPYKELKKYDSNPGISIVSLGGVARNIAENLARLDIKTSLLTVLGSDGYARDIKESCKNLGIDLSHSLFLDRERTSTYLCINDRDGDMQMAISDMQIYENISPDYLKTKLDIINKAQVVVADTNITEEALKFLMKACKVPLFLDTVSTEKTKKISSFMHNIHTLKPNIIEAEILSGISIKSIEDMGKAADIIIRKGVERLFVSMGEKGLYFNDGSSSGLVDAIKTKVVSTTGAGDSFVAGLVYAYLNSMDTIESARIGQAASSICIGSTRTVSEDMSVDNIKLLVKNNWR